MKGAEGIKTGDGVKDCVTGIVYKVMRIKGSMVVMEREDSSGHRLTDLDALGSIYEKVRPISQHS